jgi:hypothetical protein
MAKLRDEALPKQRWKRQKQPHVRAVRNPNDAAAGSHRDRPCGRQHPMRDHFFWLERGHASACVMHPFHGAHASPGRVRKTGCNARPSKRTASWKRHDGKLTIIAASMSDTGHDDDDLVASARAQHRFCANEVPGRVLFIGGKARCHKDAAHPRRLPGKRKK